MNSSLKEMLIFALLLLMNGALLISLFLLGKFDIPILLNWGDRAKMISGLALALDVLKKLLIDKIKG